MVVLSTNVRFVLLPLVVLLSPALATHRVATHKAVDASQHKTSYRQLLQHEKKANAHRAHAPAGQSAAFLEAQSASFAARKAVADKAAQAADTAAASAVAEIAGEEAPVSQSQARVAPTPLPLSLVRARIFAKKVPAPRAVRRAPRVAPSLLLRRSRGLKAQRHHHHRHAAPAPSPANSPAGAPGPSPSEVSWEDRSLDDYEKMCKDLCKFDTGLDADDTSCVTECNVYVQSGGNLEDLRSFVTDETYNENGGEAMEKHFEDVTGESVPDCEPSIEFSPTTSFDLVDTDGDGRINWDELVAFGHKACVPDEMLRQLWDAANLDMDDSISKKEFNELGENTAIESVIDKWADRATQGEDQYEPVVLPDFHHVDADGDGKLNTDEVVNIFRSEMQKRVPNDPKTMEEALNSPTTKEMVEDVMNVADLDRDGSITEEEYFAASDSGGMGKELSEEFAKPNNLDDPDDLHRKYEPSVPGPAPGPGGDVASPAPAA